MSKSQFDANHAFERQIGDNQNGMLRETYNEDGFTEECEAEPYINKSMSKVSYATIIKDSVKEFKAILFKNI